MCGNEEQQLSQHIILSAWVKLIRNSRHRTAPLESVFSRPSQLRSVSHAGVMSKGRPSTKTTFCSSQATTTINQPGSAVQTTAIQTDTACFGVNAGAALANSVGGNGGPYLFKWSGNQATPAINLLAPGSYSAVVRGGAEEGGDVLVDEIANRVAPT